ncbi:cadherin domain-containing protein [Roseibium sp.]|uniref:cadherin domain-containing protein n=1 Tax=Roseibium sp. TaxID=1936156 RepID=UPI003B526BCD
MATEAETRKPAQKDNSSSGGESQTTLSSDNYLNSGFLDTRDPKLDKAHDYHLEQDLGETMEQVNANLHLGTDDDAKDYTAFVEDGTSDVSGQAVVDPLASAAASEAFGVDAGQSGGQSFTGDENSSFAGSGTSSPSGGSQDQTIQGGASSRSRLVPESGSDPAQNTEAGSDGGASAFPAASAALPDAESDVAAGPVASELQDVVDADTAVNSVGEDAGIGDSTGIQAFADVADGASVTYSLIDDAGGLFTIDPVTGIVSVAGELDAETAGSHTIEVLVTASDGATETQTFTIVLQDVNEFGITDVADTDSAADGFSEDAEGGTYTGITVEASDNDASDSVTYSVSDSRFEIDENGVVTTKDGASFDADTEPSVSLTVTATSTDGSTSSQTFTLTIADVDEFDIGAVTDVDGSFNQISEFAEAGDIVGITAFASDEDVSATVSYSVDDPRFTIDAEGTVRVAEGASFDAETEGAISLTITATSSDGSTSSQTFSVKVSDENEFGVSATTDLDASANTIAEDAGAGTTVGIKVSATDNDATDTVSYSVDDGRFEVAANGTVTVADGASFDAETESSIDVTVTSTSTDGSTSNQTFTIDVTDVNESDVSATTDTDASDNTIAEDASEGTAVGITASATDEDTTDTVSYAVDDGRFTVDADGTVRVAAGAAFDAETEGSIDITVTSTSTDGTTSQETFTVAVSDVNEADISATTDTDASDNTIAEDASEGTAVGITASATDDDVTDTVSYSVDDGRFTVDADGTVRVAAGAAFDAETEGSIDITVTSTSTDGTTSQETFTVAVSDVNEADVSATTDTDASDNNIAEDASEGTAVGITASATDDDVTDTVSYSVDDGRFTVDADGTVRVAAGAAFDAETEGSIDITVTSTSTDGTTSQETFTVAVSDVNESDVSATTDTDASDNTIAEDASEGTAVGITASATDDDATDTVSYAVDDGRFTVDADGTVRVAAGAAFDAETEGSIDITVTSTSTDGTTSQETFTVAVSDVNESDVSATTDTDAADNTIAEDASEGTAVGITASATDDDVTDTVSYSVDDGRFTVDADGTVRVAAGAAFDAETEGSIDITVTSTSTDGTTSQETFTVAVSDVNESDVSATTDTDASDNTIAEDASEGTAVGITASATDDDVTDTVSYSVDDGRFTVDADGTVRVAAGAAFDAETEGSIDITVTSTSTDGTTSQETFTVAVSDVNESDVSATTDTDASDNTIAEDASEGTAVGITASATDDDVTDTVSYSVDDGRFTVDADGTVRVAAGAAFDAETEGSIDITVTSTSTDGTTSQETFTVAVSDVNESDISATTDTDASDNTIAEDASEGTAVGITASATDDDVTDTVSYSVDDGRFTVDADGTVRVAAGAAFDAETEGSIDITVTSTSTDGTTSQETFTVAVSDVNESDVSATTDTDASDDTIAEDASEGTAVGITASATDDDVTDTVSYSVDDGRFTVDADGTVRVAAGAAFDAETEGSIDITVTSTSTDGTTSQETFTVAVSDVNESDVSATTDTDASDNNIAEDASEGTAVGITASATDDDVTDTVSYSVDDGRFTVDADGTVRVAAGAAFDAETEGSIDITVTSTSTDGTTSQETFTVAVSDVNESDISATIDTDASDNTIAEDASEGTAVGITASATDDDVTDTVSYSVDDGRFTVDADGTVRVAAGAAFDAETEGSIDITVTSTSTDGTTSQETFTVAVSDVNEADISATTDTDASDNTIAEDASEGTAVGITASATDDDVTDTVSYSVDDGRFTVDADGTVRVAAGAAFDAETEGSIDITVTSTSTDGTTSQETFTVAVSDVNEADVSATTDTDASDNTIAEDASEGTAVGITASATDDDATDTVSYTVDDGRFTVDADGTVRVAAGAAFDAETEGSIDITVTSTSTDGTTSQETFTVAVSDVNESDISATTDTDASDNTIAEDASEGTAVGITASATDDDVTDTVSYSVDDGRFTVDADGTVRVAAGAAFDAETEGSIDITVTSTSTDGTTSQETFTVAVSDVNESDVSATTDTDASDNTIAEDASEGTAVGITASATDDDATDTVSYAVDDGRFTVDADGTVRVAAGAAFDAETEGSIDITVTSTSTDGTTSQETFTVAVSDVNESDVSATTDTDAADNTIAEDASEGTAVGITASATDDDVTDTVSYSVDDGRFTVDADGTVRVAAGAAFDAETEGSIDITVTSTSTDGTTSQETFTVAVSDVNESDISATTDTDASDNTIAEDASEGTAVGITASATDDDVTDTVSYSVDDGRFTVDADGTVRVAAGAAFDAETEGSIDITVTSTSTDGTTSQETFTVAVSDVNESDISATTDTDASDNTIAEDASEGTAVGITASATDDDVTDTVSYSVDDGRFTVDADGTVRVAAGAAFDAETEGSIDITVTSTSTDGTTSQETFTVAVSDVNEADVSATTDTDASDNTIAEDASEGAAVGITASATDDDATDTVSYTVDDGRFTVDADGTVRVAAGAAFDAETEGSIDITVTSTSTDGTTSQETFTVAVSDVDEFDVGAITDTDATANTIAEDASAGTTVGVTAFAEDTDADDIVSYTIDDNRFEIAADGTVTVASDASFDHETESSIDFTVTATSTDGSTSQETFTIDVSDVNEEAVSAVTDADASANSVDEDAAAGTTVGVTAIATDSDSTDEVSYSIDDNRFEVAADGTVTVAEGASFDAETEGSIDITVTATSTDGSTSQETFSVGVNDVNETSVGATTDADAAANTVAEDAAIGTEVGITAQAEDSDVSDDVTYNLSDDAGGKFAIDADTGVVTVAGDLDYEAATSHTIEVTATSSDGSTSTQNFTVNVSDTADETPTDMTFTGNENLRIENGTISAGSVVAEVATVADADAGDTFTYSLTDTADGKFAIDSSSGEISLVSDHDASTAYNDTVTVQVTDSGGNSYSESVGIYLGTDDADTLTGTGLTDIMYGFDGSDTLDGGAGDDSLYAADDDYETVGASGEVGSNYSLIRLGNTADIDPDESNSASENASDLLGSYGTSDEPLYTQIVDATANNTNGDEILQDNDNNRTAETFTIEGSDYGLDAVQGYDATVTFTDGSTGTFTAVVIQLDNGDVYLAPEYASNDDATLLTSGPIQGISLDTELGDYSLYANRLDTDYVTTEGDTLIGGEGNDTLVGSIGDDTLNGGDGNDTLTGGDGTNTLTGGDGDDTFIGGSGVDAIDGGAGTDHVDYSNSTEAVHLAMQDTDSSGIDGEYTNTSAGGFSGDAAGDSYSNLEEVTTTDFDDKVYGGDTDMTFNLGDGNDVFDTGTNAAVDTVNAGAGDDTLWTGDGADVIDGGEGVDRVFGEAGNDTIDGGAGNDVIYGQSGDDTLTGGTGSDSLIGGDGSDLFMHGLGDGNDTIYGGSGGGWTDVIDMSGSDSGGAVGDYGTDWTETISSGSVDATDTENQSLDLSDDAAGAVDFSDSSQVNFTDVEEIRW